LLEAIWFKLKTRSSGQVDTEPVPPGWYQQVILALAWPSCFCTQRSSIYAERPLLIVQPVQLYDGCHHKCAASFGRAAIQNGNETLFSAFRDCDRATAHS
jgi:hypothetical protein